jgi:hypothetical protein
MVRTYAVGRANSAVRLDEHTGPWVNLVTQGSVDSIWRDVMSDPSNPDKVVIIGTAEDTSLVNVSIQVSFDAGVTWTIPTGTWANDTSILHEVWYVDTNIIWAVGENGVVVKSIDGGLSFDTVLTAPGLIVAGDIPYTAAIHALDNQVAVVLGSPTSGLGEFLCYVWKTIDGGNTWTLLNGGNTLLNIIGTLSTNPAGKANGIWISEDEQRIIAATGYTQQLSIDAGITFTQVAPEMTRSGVHLTWFPSYDPNPQYFRHVGGAPIEVNESTDSGVTYQTTRMYVFPVAIPPTNTAVQITAAHFYTAYDGYYAYHSAGTTYIESTNDGAASGVASYANPDPFTSYEAIWTSGEILPPPPPPPSGSCFELQDCLGITPSIITYIDLSALVGNVVSLKDDSNHEAPGCWLVLDYAGDCDGSVFVDVYKCYTDCEDCLPVPEVPCDPKPRVVYPNYITGICNPEIVDKAFCDFAEMMYDRMMALRYRIKTCCPKDDVLVYVRKEKVNLKLISTGAPIPIPYNEYVFAQTESEAETIIQYLDDSGTLITITVPACDIRIGCEPITFCAQYGSIIIGTTSVIAINELCDEGNTCATNVYLTYVGLCSILVDPCTP